MIGPLFCQKTFSVILTALMNYHTSPIRRSWWRKKSDLDHYPQQTDERTLIDDTEKKCPIGLLKYTYIHCMFLLRVLSWAGNSDSLNPASTLFSLATHKGDWIKVNAFMQLYESTPILHFVSCWIASFPNYSIRSYVPFSLVFLHKNHIAVKAWWVIWLQRSLALTFSRNNTFHISLLTPTKCEICTFFFFSLYCLWLTRPVPKRLFLVFA